MKAILIHPKSKKKTNKIPDHVLKSIDKSIKQFKDGLSISLDEFKEKHFYIKASHKV